MGENYPQLNDVIAVTLCNFELWPQRQDGGGLYRVPMLSRWRMQEQHGGERGLPELQYVFVELPKYQTGKRPRTTVDKWSYFFREAPSLQRVPDELAEGPYAQALEVARTANLTEAEWIEYEREKMAEQHFRGGLSLAEQRGEQRGHQRGLQEGEQRGQALATARAVLSARGLQVGAELQTRVLSTPDQATLSGWLARAATIATTDNFDRL